MTDGGAKSVTIIGGGISGLAAAWKLRQISPSIRITLLESSNCVGGVLQTQKIDGFLVETAADMFTSQPATALELCREIGFGDQLLTTNEPKHKAFVGLGEKVVPVPTGFSLMVPSSDEPILAWPLLSDSGKQRLLGEVNVASRDYNADSADEDFASFAIRRFGQEAFDVLIQPLVSGIYSADPKKLSMNATMQRFVEMEKEYGSLIKAVRQKAAAESTSDSRASGARYNLFRTPKRGFGSLVKALVEATPNIEIKTAASVQQITRGENSDWKIQCDSGDCLFGDNVLLATPADATAKLFPNTAEFFELKENLRQIQSTSCAIVAMGIDQNDLPRDFEGFGVIYPHIDDGLTIAISFASHKFAGRAPDGKVLLRFFIGGAMQEALVDLPDKALIEISLQQFERSMGTKPQLEFVDVFRWKDAMPQYHVGHLDRVERIETCASRIEGLELAGKSYRGVGIPACIASGFAAAERIAK